MSINIPIAFTQRIQSQFGAEAPNFLEALGVCPVVSVRLNPMKPSGAEWAGSTEVPWCSDGRYLLEKPVFTLDPLFHAGCYYPQEASSMVIDWLLRNVFNLPDQPKLLDLCGAPGGKSTLLASFLNGNGLLVANEVIKSRATILSENLLKWGPSNVVVTRNDPSDFSNLNSFFDLMLVDAPCSGEGMFRKDQRAVDEWSDDNARMCALRQQRILTDVWPALHEGGYLIYSTCTFNPAENEENIAWFAMEHGANVLPLNVPETWGVQSIPVADGNGLAFYPHLVKGEGFFVAVLQKTSSEKINHFFIKHDKNKGNIKIPVNLNHLLSYNRKWAFQEGKEGWNAFNANLLSELYFLQQKLSIVDYGIRLGQFMKENLIPHHGLSMSCDLNMQAFSKVELTKYEALRFLKGEILIPPAHCEKGYAIITYQDVPLGFAKNIGTRMNNLYPTNWRIRMSIA